MGPNILRGIEATFQGPITITSPMSSAPQPAVTWLDIVDYVNDNPLAYDIEIVPGRGRVCQLNLEGVEVEILEADWRLSSGRGTSVTSPARRRMHSRPTRALN